MLATTALAGSGFNQSPRLVNLAGFFQRASIVTGFGWLTALSAQALAQAPAASGGRRHLNRPFRPSTAHLTRQNRTFTPSAAMHKITACPTDHLCVTGGLLCGRRRDGPLIIARRPAVRYAANDDCPAGCGHPEPAVLVRRLVALLSAAFPLRDGATHLEMGSDAQAEQRLQGFESLRCRGRGGFDRGGFPASAEGQMSGSNQRRASRRFYRPTTAGL